MRNNRNRRRGEDGSASAGGQGMVLKFPGLRESFSKGGDWADFVFVCRASVETFEAGE